MQDLEQMIRIYSERRAELEKQYHQLTGAIEALRQLKEVGQDNGPGEAEG